MSGHAAHDVSYAGRRIRTDLALGLPVDRSAVAGQRDVVITRLAPATTDLPVYERVIVRGHQGPRPIAVGWAATGWVAWVPPYLTASLTSTRIDITPFPVAKDEQLADHVIGNVLPFWLAIVGDWAFHASVVVHPAAGCVGVLGGSRTGKSTCAAALVAAGARLLADDTATGTIVGNEVLLAPTSSTLHLRGRAQGLAAAIAAAPPRTDAEQRVVVDVAHTARPTRLERLLFLALEPSATTTPRRLSPPEVVTRLLDNSRISAWVDPEFRMREFDAAAEIAACVPGYEIAPPTECHTPNDFATYARAITNFA